MIEKIRGRYLRSHMGFSKSKIVNQIQCSEKIMRCLSRLFFKHIRTSSNSPATAPANMTIDFNKTRVVIRLQSGHIQWLSRGIVSGWAISKHSPSSTYRYNINKSYSHSSRRVYLERALSLHPLPVCPAQCLDWCCCVPQQGFRVFGY